MSLLHRTMTAIRRGNNYSAPVQPTPPWREEGEQCSPPDPPPPAPEPDTPAPEPAPAPSPVDPPVAQTAPEPEPPLIETFESLYGLLSGYLACSDHQCIVLALWIMHTYCYQDFPVTPYLNISSPENQSGKTVCMRLLSLLASNVWMPAGGLTATRLMQQIAQRRPTLLLDDWHTAFRPTEAQAIIGFLNSGCGEESWYSARAPREDDVNIYCPKAFAGSQPLPASLSGHSIPIMLQRPRPSDRLRPFCIYIARSATQPLTEQIRRWMLDPGNNQALVRQAVKFFMSGLPGFPPRQRERALPLLTIAHMVGGKWPRRARIALLRIFDLHQPDDGVGIQLLADIRSFFIQHPDCKKASTAKLLEYLIDLQDRPWKRYHGTKSLTPNGLRALLRKYGVARASNQRLEDGCRFKGFRRSDFQAAWSRYLPEVVPPHSEVVPNAPEVVPNLAEVVPETAEVVPINSVSASE